VSVPLLKLDLDPETYARLVAEADAERRPIHWQAEVTLRRAFGLPFPPADGLTGSSRTEHQESER
jgi:hypothetical protein